MSSFINNFQNFCHIVFKIVFIARCAFHRWRQRRVDWNCSRRKLNFKVFSERLSIIHCWVVSEWRSSSKVSFLVELSHLNYIHSYFSNNLKVSSLDIRDEGTLLDIRNISTVFSGKLECVAQNRLGVDRKIFNLKINGMIEVFLSVSSFLLEKHFRMLPAIRKYLSNRSIFIMYIYFLTISHCW